MALSNILPAPSRSGLNCQPLEEQGWPFYLLYAHVRIFLFAIEQINKDTDILPNITLGYHFYDSCLDTRKAVKSVLQILSGPGKTIPNYSCSERGKVAGFIGDHYSVTTVPIAQILGIYGHTQISYGATDYSLSDRRVYPHFFRALQNEHVHFFIISDLLKHFGWTWVGIFTSNDDGGNQQSLILTKYLNDQGICPKMSLDMPGLPEESPAPKKATSKTKHFAFKNCKVIMSDDTRKFCSSCLKAREESISGFKEQMKNELQSTSQQIRSSVLDSLPQPETSCLDPLPGFRSLGQDHGSSGFKMTGTWRNPNLQKRGSSLKKPFSFQQKRWTSWLLLMIPFLGFILDTSCQKIFLLGDKIQTSLQPEAAHAPSGNDGVYEACPGIGSSSYLSSTVFHPEDMGSVHSSSLKKGCHSSQCSSFPQMVASGEKTEFRSGLDRACLTRFFVKPGTSSSYQCAGTSGSLEGAPFLAGYGERQGSPKDQKRQMPGDPNSCRLAQKDLVPRVNPSVHKASKEVVEKARPAPSRACTQPESRLLQVVSVAPERERFIQAGLYEEVAETMMKSRNDSHVGLYTPWYPSGQRLAINTHEITWKTNNNEIPRSQCSNNCLPGQRKVQLFGIHSCCYDCVYCSEGEISNVTDSDNCLKCPADEWPNEKKDRCIPKVVEFLSYTDDTLTAIMASVSVLFCLITLAVLRFFILHWNKYIVKANNRNLSFILLVSIMLSFLCVFLFLGRPVDITCILRQTSFGIIFSVAVSSVLAKTIMVCIAFKATRPGSEWNKCIGVKLPISIVLFCSFIQVLINICWLTISPPFKEQDMNSYQGKIIIQCNEGSVIAFYSVLGYLGILAAVSFIIAFLARKLPDSFNEAKYITFSMLVFCSVWIAMIPVYLSTKGKYMVAVEIFAILTSNAGLLSCIFFPKCYIILFRPEMNSKTCMLKITD
ncbi:G-protein coupled receptor family C group 6 member A-like [Spea bombifrons]|uniref:G-protein coupled receptor family C group 6 member A-like n=1 Tax=Spea bombifrons TaxID=233779 RepID=UPI00234AE1AA|nr:G-protein coupled receptor family C group 6 member A-like [Spea bombifrons]